MYICKNIKIIIFNFLKIFEYNYKNIIKNEIYYNNLIEIICDT